MQIQSTPDDWFDAVPGHLLQEDAGEELANHVVGFLRR
jgi:hypothetical protein